MTAGIVDSIPFSNRNRCQPRGRDHRFLVHVSALSCTTLANATHYPLLRYHERVQRGPAARKEFYIDSTSVQKRLQGQL